MAVVWAAVSSCCPLFVSLFFVTCPLQELNSSVGRDLQRSSHPTARPLWGQPELNEGIVPMGHPPPLGNVLHTWTAGLHISFILWRGDISALQMNLFSPTSPWQIGSVWQHRKAKLPFVNAHFSLQLWWWMMYVLSSSQYFGFCTAHCWRSWGSGSQVWAMLTSHWDVWIRQEAVGKQSSMNRVCGVRLESICSVLLSWMLIVRFFREQEVTSVNQF